MENLCREEENLIKDIKKAFQNKKKKLNSTARYKKPF